VSLWKEYGHALAGPDDATRRRIERNVLAPPGTSPRRRIRFVRGYMVAAAAVVLLALSVGLHRWSAAPTPAMVQVATSTSAQELALPRGGVLQVGPSSRVALQVSDETGAVVRLHAGEVTLRVHAADGLRWIVDVDDYSVEALGTRFRVRHTKGVPLVSVDEGVVRLTGPGLPEDGVRISATAWVDEGPKPHPDEKTHERLKGPSTDPEPEARLDAAQMTEIETPSTADAVDQPRARATWISRFRDAIDAGDSARAVATLPKGFPTGREPLAAADFLDAGDALASQRESERAERAYGAACRRPDAPACGVATFRLALIAARRSDTATAIDLSTRYLEQHPRGSLVREVLGRRMQWLETRGDLDGARRDAKRYLASWPDGPHAKRARRMAGEPLDTP
jgi:transmembrane sensor